MLGRKTYTREELDHGRRAIDRQLSRYKALAAEVPGDSTALADFEPELLNNLVLVLDRFYVHRLRGVAGKDTNPLNEVAIIAESVVSHGGVLTAGNGVKYVPERAVVQLKVGDRIRLSLDDVERLAAAFFTELERRYAET
jgi:hypothetical protein